MFIDLVFSFLLSTVISLPDVGLELGFRRSFQMEQAMLCSLEKAGLLVYDGKWHSSENLKIPADCMNNQTGSLKVTGLRVRSESLNSPLGPSAWDHRITIKAGEGPSFVTLIRQDSKYIGAHSSSGWAMWAERRSGQFRLESVDQRQSIHVRLKATGELNPMKGGYSGFHSLEALYVKVQQGKAHKAVTVSGTPADGYKTLRYEQSKKGWHLANQRCSLEKGCRVNAPIHIEESQALKFGNIESDDFIHFLQDGQPLAFTSVMPDEVLPLIGTYR